MDAEKGKGGILVYLIFFSGKLIFGKEKNRSTNDWIGSTRENKRGNKISSFIKLLFSKEWKNT